MPGTAIRQTPPAKHRPPDTARQHGRLTAGRRVVRHAGVLLVLFIFMFDENAVLDGLNEQQRQAVTHQGGPLLVLAGAGTGKTRTLVARAAWLRGAQDVPASRILLLTFTRRAASDMLARANAGSEGAGWEGTGSDGAGGKIWGGTFH